MRGIGATTGRGRRAILRSRYRATVAKSCRRRRQRGAAGLVGVEVIVVWVLGAVLAPFLRIATTD
jgi:hypothetical protein